jgi:multicomponent Na+:H+ antiporter subunit B
VTRRQLRGTLAVPVLAALGVLLLWGFSGLPPFGDFHGFYGRLLNHVAVPQRHTTNVVAAVVFDYRGLDTLGEEFILFAAVTGVVLLLRESEGDEEAEPGDEAEVSSHALRYFGTIAIGLVVLVGLWLVAFGLVTPGGGFQGGVVVASALLVLYLAVGYRAWKRLAKEEVVDPVEGVGAGGYVVVGLAALISAAPFLHNLLGPGKSGTLFSGGSMSFLNWAVALEVAAANLTLYAEFLQRYIEPLLRRRE